MKVFVLAILLVVVCCLKGAVVKRDEGEAKRQVEAHSQQKREDGDDDPRKVVQEFIQEIFELFVDFNKTTTADEIKQETEELKQELKDIGETVQDLFSKFLHVTLYLVNMVQDEAAHQASEVPPQETD